MFLAKQMAQDSLKAPALKPPPPGGSAGNSTPPTAAASTATIAKPVEAPAAGVASPPVARPVVVGPYPTP